MRTLRWAAWILLISSAALAEESLNRRAYSVISVNASVHEGNLLEVRSGMERLAAELGKVPGLQVVRLEVEEVDEHFEYVKQAGEKVADLVVRRFRGCVAYDAQCRTWVRNLNRRSLEDLDEYQGEVVLPGKASRFSVQFELREVKQIAFGESLQRCSAGEVRKVRYFFFPRELKDVIDRTHRAQPRMMLGGSFPIIMPGSVSHGCSEYKAEVVWLPAAQLMEAESVAFFEQVEEAIFGMVRARFPGAWFSDREIKGGPRSGTPHSSRESEGLSNIAK